MYYETLIYYFLLLAYLPLYLHKINILFLLRGMIVITAVLKLLFKL